MVIPRRLKSVLYRIKKKLLTPSNIIEYRVTSAAATEGEILEFVPTVKNTQYLGANWLASFKDNQHSEHGEDGIIEKVFSILKPQNKWVCEFGAHDPEIISNTWRLIQKEKWNAVLIEADDVYFNKLNNYYAQNDRVHTLHTKVSFEGDERLDIILKQTPIPQDMDLMVIDIDGNDYHVWDALKEYAPKVLMIEFNASIPTEVAFIQPADLNVNQGNSLHAVDELAKSKGYRLIAVTSWNAIFVQHAYFNLFFHTEPHLSSMYVYPAKHPITMQVFQLYDGTIRIARWQEMLWHKIDLQPNDYQVLPDHLRFFSRELAYCNYVLNAGKKQSTSVENEHYNEQVLKMPANVLGQYAENVYSRHGEDGILEKIIYSFQIEHQFIIDVGAWDGKTNSRSYNMLKNHGWRGLLIENDRTVTKKLLSYASKYIKTHVEPLATEGEQSLDALFTKYAVPKNPEVLILNNFGMEYYLWESLTEFQPKVVLVQFNPTIPNDIKYVQAKHFGIHQGCY